MNKTQQKNLELKKVASREVFQKIFDCGFNQAGDSYEKQLVELRPSIFQEGWLAYLKELEIPLNHLAWNAKTPPIEPSGPPVIYSPLILLGFNEKEYMNQPANEEGVAAVEVGATQGNELLGGEGEITDDGEEEKVEGVEGEGVDEGYPNSLPAEQLDFIML